ncbi:MAG: di-heme oxidoredictase family protein [Prevotella sp.]
MKTYVKIISLSMVAAMAVTSCSDDTAADNAGNVKALEADYIGKGVGNFAAEEWYPGGELGTTENVTAGCYEDEAPAVTRQGLLAEFNLGETFFERNFNAGTAPFNGLGPASVRRSCIDCHPGYGHGKRQTSYRATFGNGYLLAIYHPLDGANSNDGPYISEVTGMPQTQAAYPFMPPVDEEKISITWHEVTAMESGLPMEFEDGERYSLIYPEVTIPTTAFNTKPQPENIAVRLESTIGIMGTGLLDAITEDDLREQYRAEAKYVELNPAMWDTGANDFASTAWYTLADGTKAVKRFTYALTRASLQDGAGANAVWNITNVSRSDRPYLYTTKAWAEAMAETPSVIAAIKADPTSPYHADGTESGIADAVRNLLSPSTNQFDNPWYRFEAEMSDYNFYAFLVWHRGLAIPRARNLHDPEVQQGKKVFNEIGCATCHRPSWKTGKDNYWAPAIVGSRPLPRFPEQVIYPYSDMIQHKLAMKNDIHGSWCRTTPLWGRGLSLVNTGAEDRLHDCRARNEIEAIMWHGYSRDSHAYESAERFYHLSKADRDAVVKFLRAI